MITLIAPQRLDLHLKTFESFFSSSLSLSVLSLSLPSPQCWWIGLISYTVLLFFPSVFGSEPPLISFPPWYRLVACVRTMASLRHIHADCRVHVSTPPPPHHTELHTLHPPIHPSIQPLYLSAAGGMHGSLPFDSTRDALVVLHLLGTVHAKVLAWQDDTCHTDGRVGQ